MLSEVPYWLPAFIPRADIPRRRGHERIADVHSLEPDKMLHISTLHWRTELQLHLITLTNHRPISTRLEFPSTPVPGWEVKSAGGIINLKVTMSNGRIRDMDLSITNLEIMREEEHGLEVSDGQIPVLQCAVDNENLMIGCNDGTLFVVGFSNGFVQKEVNGGYIPQMVRSMFTPLVKKRDSMQQAVSMDSHVAWDDVVVMVLQRQGRLEAWSAKKQKCIATIDECCGVLPATPRRRMQILGVCDNVLYTAVLDGEDVCVVKLFVEDGKHTMDHNKILELDGKGDESVDFFAETDKRLLWILWKSRDGNCRLQYAKYTLEEGFGLEVWHKVQTEMLPDASSELEYVEEEILDDSYDISDAFMTHIMNPGRFDMQLVAKAAGVSPSGDLECSIRQMIHQTQANLGGDYGKNIRREWARFLATVVGLHVRRMRVCGIAFFGYGMVVVRVDGVGFLRAMDCLECLCDESLNLKTISDLFPKDWNTLEDAAKLVELSQLDAPISDKQNLKYESAMQELLLPEKSDSPKFSVNSILGQVVVNASRQLVETRFQVLIATSIPEKIRRQRWLLMQMMDTDELGLNGLSMDTARGPSGIFEAVVKRLDNMQFRLEDFSHEIREAAIAMLHIDEMEIARTLLHLGQIEVADCYIQTLPIQAAVLTLKAEVRLSQGEFAKAHKLFSSTHSFRSDEYHRIAEKFESQGAHQQALMMYRITNLALSTSHQQVFRCALKLQLYDEAFMALLSIPASDQIVAARQLVTELCEQNSAEILFSLPLGPLRPMVLDILEFKARSTTPTSSLDYYHILYAFHIYQGDYRSAANTMFASKHMYGDGDFMVQGSEMARRLLAAIHALYLSPQRWLYTPDKKVIPLEALEKEYALLVAKLRLGKSQPEAAAICWGLSAAETAGLLAQSGDFDEAFRLCRATSIDCDVVAQEAGRQGLWRFGAPKAAIEAAAEARQPIPFHANYHILLQALIKAGRISDARRIAEQRGGVLPCSLLDTLAIK